MTHVELTEVVEYRREYVQDLSKHHIEIVKKYRNAFERLIKFRNEFTHPASSIITENLVMRISLNRKSKLHSK